MSMTRRSILLPIDRLIERKIMFAFRYARSISGCVFVTLFLLYPVCVGQSADSAGWLSSNKGMRFRLGGELEFEYVDTQNDAGIGQPSGHFQIDKFTLKPHVRIAGNIILESLLLFKVDGAYASEAYVIFSGLPLNSSLKIGLDDRFIDEKPGRKTEGFSLIDTVFARDDELALTWNGQHGNSYWVMSLSNGLELAQQSPSEDKSYKLIHDNRQTGDVNDNKEVGFGVGWKRPLSRECLMSVFVFGYTARLSRKDIDFLQDIKGYGTSESNKNNMYGVIMEYGLKGLSLGGKYIRARDGALDRYGWFAQVSCKIGLDRRKLFTAVSPLIRHGHLNVDLPHVPSDPLTWDRDMTTLALLIEVTRNVILKAEYYLNGETTGRDDVNNDEFLLQLEVKF